MDYLRLDLDKHVEVEQDRRAKLRNQWKGACEILDRASMSNLAAAQQVLLLQAIAEFLKIQTDIATKL